MAASAPKHGYLYFIVLESPLKQGVPRHSSGPVNPAIDMSIPVLSVSPAPCPLTSMSPMRTFWSHYNDTPPVNSGKASDGGRSLLPRRQRTRGQREEDWVGRLTGMPPSFLASCAPYPSLPSIVGENVHFSGLRRVAKQVFSYIISPLP